MRRSVPAKNKTDTSRKAINMVPQAPLRETQARNWEFFLSLPEVDRSPLNLHSGQRLAALAAAVRVLGRLRRLR